MRIDVFKAKKAAKANIISSGTKLSDEDQRLVDKMILEGRRSGLDLPEDTREELTKLKKEVSQICVEFSVSENIRSCLLSCLNKSLYIEKLQ